MAIFEQELKTQRRSVLIWSLSIGLMIAACVLMYPDMESEMENVNEMFASMGSFTAAFGMDQLNFGTLIGFYGVEGGNILGIGGAFFAAITGINALMKEERDKTAEFLMTHPVSRTRVVTEKLLGAVITILLLNAIVLLCAGISIKMIGSEMDWGDFLLFHLAYLILQLEIAGICFGISAFITRSGAGIGIGIASLLYFLNIAANISKDAEALKYITPFGYTEASDILNTHTLNTGYLACGLLLMAAGVAAGYVKYTRKDLRA